MGSIISRDRDKVVSIDEVEVQRYYDIIVSNRSYNIPVYIISQEFRPYRKGSNLIKNAYFFFFFSLLNGKYIGPVKNKHNFLIAHRRVNKDRSLKIG